MGKAILLLALVMAAASLMAGAGPGSTRPFADAITDGLLDRYRPMLERAGFAWTTAGPFVVAGDMSAGELRSWRYRTILPAIRAFQAAYFDTRPTQPVLILLFGSDSSYRRYAKEWFSDTDVSHFGYFRRDGVMLMNITTGGGTLVHEMVHALLRPDFPECPNWLNEGLGSLYEQCSLEPLNGLPNWRLPALQQAIRAGTLRPLSDLIQSPDFYEKASVGMNYAQARYLLMYLQEKGQLRAFYQAARDHHATDATAMNALKAVIAPRKLDEFESDWREWVLSLRFQ